MRGEGRGEKTRVDGRRSLCRSVLPTCPQPKRRTDTAGNLFPLPREREPGREVPYTKGEMVCHKVCAR